MVFSYFVISCVFHGVCLRLLFRIKCRLVVFPRLSIGLRLWFLAEAFQVRVTSSPHRFCTLDIDVYDVGRFAGALDPIRRENENSSEQM